MKISHKTIPSFFIAIATIIALPFGSSAQQAAETKKCFIISDVHFDPFFGAHGDTALYNLLQRTPVSGWQNCFKNSKAQNAINGGLLGKDANLAVLQSAISNMKQQLPNPAFIMIAGDFIWHGAEPKDSVIKRKSIQFIARLFKVAFPGTTIIPALGNNDTYGTDYALQDAAFFRDFADAWQPNLPKISAIELAQRGYYAIKKDNLRILVINTASLSLGSKYPEQASKMLQWLEAELSNPANKNVWLLMHIPPGANSYNKKMMWNVNSEAAFLNSVLQHANKVKLSIASHTHFNDFKVFYNAANEPAALLRLIPSIGSNHGNNPSFEIAEFNSSTGTLVNETSYYLNLTQIPFNNTTDRFIWSDVLGPKQTLGLSSIDAKQFSAFMEKIKTDKTGTALQAYMSFYDVNTPVDTLFTVNSTNYKNYLKADSLKVK